MADACLAERPDLRHPPGRPAGHRHGTPAWRRAVPADVSGRGRPAARRAAWSSRLRLDRRGGRSKPDIARPPLCGPVVRSRPPHRFARHWRRLGQGDVSVASWAPKPGPWNMLRVDVTTASDFKVARTGWGERRRRRRSPGRRVPHMAAERRGRRCPRRDRALRVLQLLLGASPISRGRAESRSRRSVAGVLVVRTLRRAVIVSPFGLEVRRTFITWRVPWSVVESFAVRGFRGRARSAGPLTVVLVDGSVRSVRVGARRHRQRDFSEVADAARRRPNVRPRGYLGANSPLVLFVLSGIALMVACAVADIARLEHRYLTGLPSTRAAELRGLEHRIVFGDGFAVLLYVIVVVTGIAAVVWSRRARGAAPVGRWPEQFPDDLGGTSWPPPAADGERPAVGSLPPPQSPAERTSPTRHPAGGHLPRRRRVRRRRDLVGGRLASQRR